MGRTQSQIFRQSTRGLVRELLMGPELERELARASGRTWKALVTQVGLEDSGELLAYASPSQLLELLDEDLWASEGDEETVDLERFALFLEVLRESNALGWTRKVAELSEDFLVQSLAGLVSVWPISFLESHAAFDEHGLLEKKLESQCSEEFGDFLVLSKTGVGSDAVIDLLSSWNEAESDLLDRVLTHLAQVSVEEIAEPDDLVTALSGLESLQEDAAAEREERRAQRGHVSARDARAFLRLPLLDEPETADAITKAYFRRLRDQTPSEGVPRLSALRELHKRMDAREYRALGEPERLLKSVLRDLSMSDPALHSRCVDEFAFLINVVLADGVTYAHVTHLGDALRIVSERVERAGLCSVEGTESDVSAARRLTDALGRWGVIGLFRRKIDS